METFPRTHLEVNNLDLSFMNEKHSEDMIRDIMNAVISVQESVRHREIDVWEYLHNYSPPSNTGFMFCDDDIVNRISHFSNMGHSGSSFAWTMRQLEFIAKNGLLALRELYKK